MSQLTYETTESDLVAGGMVLFWRDKNWRGAVRHQLLITIPVIALSAIAAALFEVSLLKWMALGTAIAVVAWLGVTLVVNPLVFWSRMWDAAHAGQLGRTGPTTLWFSDEGICEQGDTRFPRHTGGWTSVTSSGLVATCSSGSARPQRW